MNGEVHKLILELVQNPNFELKLSYNDRKNLRNEQIDSKVILHQQFCKDANLFLQNYSPLLSSESIQKYFLPISDHNVQYTAQHILQQRQPTQKQVKNRRFEYMEQILLPSGYFSWEQMRLRRPDLYEEYIGQYETKTNQLHTKDVQSVTFGHSGDVFQRDMKLYDRLLYNMDLNDAFAKHNMTEVLYQNEEKANHETVEAEEEESEDDDDDEAATVKPQQDSISDEEKMEWRMEFLELMKQEYLHGKDFKFVDYTQIDSSYSDYAEDEATYFSDNDEKLTDLSQYEQQREEAKQEEDYWKFPV